MKRQRPSEKCICFGGRFFTATQNAVSLFLAREREREKSADIEDKQHAASLGAADTSALIFPELRPSPPPPVEKLF